MSAKWVFEPEVLSNEVLVVFAQCGYRPARNELLVRFFAETSHLAWLLAKRAGLSLEDCEDPAQNVVFAINGAINDYDTLQIGRSKGRTFRRFVFKRVESRFFHFLRSLRRRKRREKGSDELVSVESHGAASDPVAAAEDHEMRERLEAFCASLNESDRETLELIKPGTDVVTLAGVWGKPYDASRRLYRQFLARLRDAISLETLAVAS